MLKIPTVIISFSIVYETFFLRLVTLTNGKNKMLPSADFGSKVTLCGLQLPELLYFVPNSHTLLSKKVMTLFQPLWHGYGMDIQCVLKYFNSELNNHEIQGSDTCFACGLPSVFLLSRYLLVMVVNINKHREVSTG